jgi:ribose 5-phosphate isomerase A
VDLAREVGIPVGDLVGSLDLAFDGADAVDPRGYMVKGGGGALVRERIVAAAARRWIVLVDSPKMVGGLDAWGLLPVAVVPFATDRVAGQLADLGPVRRPEPSDDGLVILDLSPPPGADWPAVADRVAALPGVVDHGLFHAPLADIFVGRPDGTWSSAA